MELAARIGQTLLEKNKVYEEKNETLEEQLSQANERVGREDTIMILRVWTDRSGQTVQEQSDQGLYCLPFRLHLLDTLFHGKTTFKKFQGNYNNFSGV